MAGRVGSYIHSDSVTPNKGGALVRVTCQTDFAARTDEFIAFVDYVAKRAYAATLADLKSDGWPRIVEAFPEAEEKRVALEKSLKESVKVDDYLVVIL